MEISLNNLAEALFEVIASFWVESWVEADLNMRAIFKDSLHNLSNSTCCEAYNYLEYYVSKWVCSEVCTYRSYNLE